MFLFVELGYFHQTFSYLMEPLITLKSFKKVENDGNYNSFWTINDDSSQASLSTSSLLLDTDVFKYMDEDSESSSSDEIYSLETSMIEMNNKDETNSEEEKSTHNQNLCYQHQSSPMVGRTVNFYDNDNFTDTIKQLANKGFAQSLARQNFLQKHKFQNVDTSLDGLLSKIKDSSNKSAKESSIVPNNFLNGDSLMERSFDMELMDNDDLMSISSHGSDRSMTPIDKDSIVKNECLKDENGNDMAVDSFIVNDERKFDCNKINEFMKPRLLKFTDSEDIEFLSPDDIRTKCNYIEETDNEDKATICGDSWTDHQDIEMCNKKLYHQPPKSADRSAAQRLARRLFELDGFKVSDVSKHLSKRNDFSQLVGEEFANFFEFDGLPLDFGLRKFLERFILVGDTQERERVIHHFSRRYLQCNPNAYNSEEACHTLVCAVMLLNTDLHGNTLNRKMTCEDFVVSMRDLNNGDNFKNEELVMLFNSILDNSIRWNLDNELIGLIQPKVDYIDFNKQISNSNFNFGQEVPSEATSKEYMNGYLLRKCIKESHFRRTSIGKRGWKLYFGRLQDLTLSLYKDEISLNGSLKRPSSKLTKDKELCINGNCYSDPVLNQMSQKGSEMVHKKLNGSDCKKSRRLIRLPRTGKSSFIQSSSKLESNKTACTDSDSTPSNSEIDSIGTLKIYLNHSYASKATDYSKKRNVFRLQVGNGSEYLFQVNEPREVELWVDCLNFVAALLSPPVFANCSSKDMSDSSLRKYNPTLTTLNIKEQLENHQRYLRTLEQDLAQLISKPPSKSDKTKLKWQYNRQRKFIERELIRYKTYSRLLEFELIHLHNMAIARVSQQAFIDPYLIPVQYSQMCGSSPLFYNQKTNQFIPLNCVPANLPVFQYQFDCSGQIGTGNNNSINELSEEISPKVVVTPQEPVSVQPIIIRSSLSCNRSSRSQLSMNKRRRYRNNSLQQPPVQTTQHQPQLLLQYNTASAIPIIKKPLLRPFLAPLTINTGSEVICNNAIPYVNDSNEDCLTTKTSDHNIPVLSLPCQPNIEPPNGTKASIAPIVYEIL